MSEQQLFLGDVVVLGFTAQRATDGSWTLIARHVREYQDWGQAGFDEYRELSATEMVDLATTIAESLLIL